jgi:hypothetical protein
MNFSATFIRKPIATAAVSFELASDTTGVSRTETGCIATL